MNKTIMAGLYFLVSRFFQGVGSGTTENLTNLKLAKAYLHLVKISRLLVISIMGSGACLILLLVGLILIHHTILFYAPWNASVKVVVTLICAASYILLAAGILAFVFAEDKWMKMFNTESTIKELAGDFQEHKIKRQNHDGC